MNVFAEVEGKVLATLKGLQQKGTLPAELDFGAVAVEQPRDPSHGDLATNAAMVLAKPAGQNPRALAERIAAAWAWSQLAPDDARIDELVALIAKDSSPQVRETARYGIELRNLRGAPRAVRETEEVAEATVEETPDLEMPSAAPEPPLDPPGMRSGAAGLTTAPNVSFADVAPKASSWRFAVPRITPPAL